MAEYLPVRGLSRSQKVRIGSQQLNPDSTVFVNLSDGKSRRDLQRHSALGSYVVVGPITGSADNIVVDWGIQVTEGTNAADLVLTAEDGELLNRTTGARKDVNQTDVTLSAADGTNPRIDIVQVHTGTGVVTKKNGTAAATPSQPAPDASNILVAAVSVPANDTAITNNQITDLRPRA